MESYISEAACRGMRPAVAHDVTLETRRFLVGKLLSKRHDARLIVAPTGFGKSLLACQYASLVFSYWHVFWLDCQDLRFLRALNDQTLAQLILQRDDEAALVVFDDVPFLSADQAQALGECVRQLQEKGCEVLACTTPICSSSFIQAGPWVASLDAKSLMVQCSEQDLLEEKACPAAAGDTFLARIPLLTWGGKDAAGALVRGFAFDELPVEDVLAGLFLFCVETLDVQLAASLPLNIQGRIESLRSAYPFFRYREDQNAYTTVTCDDELFHRVLLPLVSEMLSFLDEEDAQSCAQVLTDMLLAAQRGARACMAARFLLSPQGRKAWLEAQSLSLTFSFCSQALSELVEGVKRLYPHDEEGLEAAVLLAQAAEGIPFDHHVLWPALEQKSLSLKARCIYALLGMRTMPAGELSRNQRLLLKLLKEELEGTEVENSWQGRLFSCAFDIAWDYEASMTSLDMQVDQSDHPHGLLMRALNALWLAESAPLLSNGKRRRALVAMLERLKQCPLPMGVIAGLVRAQRVLSTGHAVQTPSTWDYHAVTVPHLRLTLWGSFSVSMGSRVFDARSFKRKKAMTLLALLATEIGCDFNRDYLVAALWPDSSLARARRNFYAVWGDLRQTLCLEDGSCPYLVRSGLSYRLEESLVECDMQEVEQLCKCLRDVSAPLAQWDQALSALTVRFGGDVLPGGPASERLDFYCDAARAGILDALMCAGRALLERGEEAAALRYARAVLSRAPQREDACELAMKSQIRLGQRTSALNTFVNCQRFLSDQLGVDPSPSVYSLYEEALGVPC